MNEIMQTGPLAVSYRSSDGQSIALDADTVRRYILTGSGSASDAEIAGFLAICQARGLNPLARDAYLVKYGSDQPASTIVSKDYWLKAASRVPSYTGFEAGIVVLTRDGKMERRAGSLFGQQTEKLVGGWAKVHDERWTVPVYAEVSLDEYTTGKSLWRSKPATMIRKVAIVQALREAYPESLGGLYDSSEVNAVSEIVYPEGEIVPEPEPQYVAPMPQPAPVPQAVPVPQPATDTEISFG